MFYSDSSLHSEMTGSMKYTQQYWCHNTFYVWNLLILFILEIRKSDILV